MYHVKTLKVTFRPENSKLTFEQELERYLNDEEHQGYVLRDVQYTVDPSEPGYVSDIKARIITQKGKAR